VTVTFRGLGHSHQASHSNGARFAAVTERNLAKNHQRPQRTLGHVVRGRNTRIIQKHEPLVLMLQNSLKLKMAEPCIAVDPVVRSLTVQSPVRFVCVDGAIAAAELLRNRPEITSGFYRGETSQPEA